MAYRYPKGHKPHNYVDGRTKNSLYFTWKGMLRRCEVGR